MPTKCKATTTSGERCKAWARPDGEFCPFHDPRPKAESNRPSNIIEAMMDDRFFGTMFTPNDTWASWTIFLKGLYGLFLDEDEKCLFSHFTGRETARPEGYLSAACVVGRRGGKSRIAALIAAYECLWGGHEKELSKGERGWAFCLGNDRQQSAVVLGYVRALLSLFPDEIERETSDEIYLRNGTAVGVRTCSFKSVRGYSTIAVVADEIAFWRDENSANPAEEVITALLPSLKPNARLISISTPYAKSGYFYNIYKEHFAKDSDELVFVAPTVEMNPTYSQETINRLIARDEARFRSEFYSEFRSDIENFLGEVLVRGAATRTLSLPDPKVRYVGHLDPSGGRSDSMTLGIAHKEGEKVILDRIEERKPPFDPSVIVEEFAGILKLYGCHSVTSDRYSGEWCAEAFRKKGIFVSVSDLVTSDIYLEGQALFTMGRCEIINDERLIRQLLSLERRTGQQGRDRVDHPPNLHDDMATAAMGALVYAARGAVWTEAEQEARMPVKRHGSPLGIATEKAQSLESELRDWMGLGFSAMNRIVRR